MTVLNDDSKRRAASPASATNRGRKEAVRLVNQIRPHAFTEDVGLSFGGVCAFRAGPVPTDAKGVQSFGVRGDLRKRAIDESAAPA
jgi:hypothetical protein